MTLGNSRAQQFIHAQQVGTIKVFYPIKRYLVSHSNSILHTFIFGFNWLLDNEL